MRRILSAILHAALLAGLLPPLVASGRFYEHIESVPVDTEALIVLVHGWNRTGISGSLYEHGSWPALTGALDARLSLADGDGWDVLLLRWEDEASTGPGFERGMDPLEEGYENAVNAAINGFEIGGYLGIALGRRENLRGVHFVAYSAGTWCAYEALATLLQQNANVVAQLTLLDPFIPDVGVGKIGGYNTGLSVSTLESLAHANEEGRIYRLENYYSIDVVPATHSRFDWRAGDINLRVPHGEHYSGHSGPVRFYADSVTATVGGTVPPGQATAPWAYTQVGFFRSLLHEGALLRPETTSRSRRIRPQKADR